ncbi:MAG: dienelactone hydrolase family protein [Pseudomonadota bacterium]
MSYKDRYGITRGSLVMKFQIPTVVKMCLSLGLILSLMILPSHSARKFTKATEMSSADIVNPNEIRRTWNAAIVRVPTAPGRSSVTTISKLMQKYGKSGKKFPVAIYMHGCGGIWAGTKRRVKFLADNGFLVIAPNSLARKKYPRSCNPVTQEGGMYRPTIKMRQLDAGFAIESAKRLPFTDNSKFLLIGLSEGGITTATFSRKNSRQSVKARVVEGWTCNAGWREYRGIRAPGSEPVLSLVGSQDPWFQNDWNRGHCGQFMSKGNGSRSVVYRTGTLARKHALLENSAARKEVLNFLRKQGLLSN